MATSSGVFYAAALVFFTLLFSVFLAVAWSVFLQVRENYFRHVQRAELQWTGHDSRFPHCRVRLLPVIAVGFLAAWVLVHRILG